jgi:hypothetical protein
MLEYLLTIFALAHSIFRFLAAAAQGGETSGLSLPSGCARAHKGGRKTTGVVVNDARTGGYCGANILRIFGKPVHVMRAATGFSGRVCAHKTGRGMGGIDTACVAATG